MQDVVEHDKSQEPDQNKTKKREERRKKGGEENIRNGPGKKLKKVSWTLEVDVGGIHDCTTRLALLMN